MKGTKRILSACLASILVVTPAISLAETQENAIVEPKYEAEYSSFEGVIETVDRKDDRITIRVKRTIEDKEDELIFHLDEEVLVFDTRPSKEEKRSHLVKGAEVSVFYPVNTPMALSMPGQLTPEVVVVRNSEEPMMVKVDRFDENLLSSDGQLKLNLEDPKDYKNKKLLVYYDMTTRSLPPQTTPKHIVVLEDKEDAKDLEEDKEVKGNITILDKINVRGKEYKTSMYKKKDNVVMVPLRDITDIMGYKITWNGKNKPVELTKGPHWTSVELNNNRYSFARMAPFELESAPELIKGRTYVPVSFINRVLDGESLEVVDGLLTVK